MKIIWLFIVTCCLSLQGCATNPVTGRSDFTLMSEAEEISQGRDFHQQIIERYGLYDDPALQQYVNRIGQALAQKSHRSHLQYHFTVLDSPDINAFALPGGYIYITRGIMAYLDSEAELAGVLGHEIGHVTARHSIRQQAGQFASSLLGILITATTGDQQLGSLSQQLGTSLVRGYGRDHELEADRLGAEYLHRSGYDPETMLEVIGVLKDQEIYEKALAAEEGRQANIYHGVFSTHPRNDDRLKTVVRAAKKLSSENYRDANQRDYREKIDGLAWGPSYQQGVVDGNRFAHPTLGFELRLPAGWKVNNNPEFLEARHPKSSALVQISVVDSKASESLPALIRRLTKSNQLKVNNRDYGASAHTRVRTPEGEDQPARVSAIRLDDKQVLTLMGTAGKNQFKTSDAAFVGINRSFKRLSEAQIAAINPPRLQIVRRGSQSFADLARNSALDYEAVNILRLLNRAFPNGDIRQLKQLKTVTTDD